MEKSVKARSFITYINKLVAKGVFPKELKAEYEVAEAKSPLQRLRDFDKSRVAVGQKPIFKDRGIKFVRMKKRGQLTIMNVPSDEVEKYIKKGYIREEWLFKDFVHQIQKGPIKEVLAKDADMGDYIDDFVKSDAPQFNGKSKEKRKEMAIAAYYAKNES